MKFKEWMNLEDNILIEWELFLQEMAVGDVLRKPVIMDQDDANYMNQFLNDPRNWKSKLKERYNEKLNASLDSNQNVIKGTDSSTSKLIRKLKSPKGYDFDMRNLHPGSEALAGFKLMRLNNANDLLYGQHGTLGWIEYSEMKTGGKRPKSASGGRLTFGGRLKADKSPSQTKTLPIIDSNFYFVPMPQPEDELYGRSHKWNPNWLSRQSFGDPEYDPKHKFVSSTMKQQVKHDVLIGVDKALYGLSDPNHTDHYAHKHMLSKKDKLIDLIVDYIFKNTKTNDWQDPKWRENIAIRITKSEAQKDWGGGTRKHAEKTRSLGLDPTKIMLRTRQGAPRKSPQLRTADASQRKSWQLQQEYPLEQDPVSSPDGYPYTEPPQEKMDRFKSQLSKIKPKKETSAERLEKWSKIFFPAKTG